MQKEYYPTLHLKVISHIFITFIKNIWHFLFDCHLCLYSHQSPHCRECSAPRANGAGARKESPDSTCSRRGGAEFLLRSKGGGKQVIVEKFTQPVANFECYHIKRNELGAFKKDSFVLGFLFKCENFIYQNLLIMLPSMYHRYRIYRGWVLP